MAASATAAFGRLSVETWYIVSELLNGYPAAFGRLSVETSCLS